MEHCSLDLDIGEVESMQLLELPTWTSMAEGMCKSRSDNEYRLMPVSNWH